MSNTALNWAIEVSEVTSSEKLVLLLLANRANDRHECWPSHPLIAKEGCLGITTVKRALGSLRQKGLIDWRQRVRPDSAHRTSNCYRLLIAPKQASGTLSAHHSPPPAVDPAQSGPVSERTDPSATMDLPPDQSGPIPPAIMGDKPKDEPSPNPKETQKVITCRVGNREGTVVVMTQ